MLFKTRGMKVLLTKFQGWLYNQRKRLRKERGGVSEMMIVVCISWTICTGTWPAELTKAVVNPTSLTTPAEFKSAPHPWILNPSLEGE